MVLFGKKWILWFNELNKSHNELVGKKCANLGEVSRLGLRVPPGFAVSLDGYELFLKKTGIDKKIQLTINTYGDQLEENVKEASDVLKDLFRSTPMPREMEKEIKKHYKKLCDLAKEQDVAVAVRSSGVVSMPGQMDTYLNVRGADQVVEKIRYVWGSAFSVRAIMYRHNKGLPPATTPIGVAVIKLIGSRSAGVLLTVIPTTGDKTKVIIEGNWGLGEIVVSGESKPDTFIVNKANFDIEEMINPKPKRVVCGLQGTIMEDVPLESQNISCLKPEEIKKMVEIACFVENHFGEPQDMEWVIDPSLTFPENIFWVQTRAAKWAKQADAQGYFTNLLGSLFKDR
jgi:pyruvate,water dikinase